MQDRFDQTGFFHAGPEGGDRCILAAVEDDADRTGLVQVDGAVGAAQVAADEGQCVLAEGGQDRRGVLVQHRADKGRAGGEGQACGQGRVAEDGRAVERGKQAGQQRHRPTLARLVHVRQDKRFGVAVIAMGAGVEIHQLHQERHFLRQGSPAGGDFLQLVEEGGFGIGQRGDHLVHDGGDIVGRGLGQQHGQVGEALDEPARDQLPPEEGIGDRRRGEDLVDFRRGERVGTMQDAHVGAQRRGIQWRFKRLLNRFRILGNTLKKSSGKFSAHDTCPNQFKTLHHSSGNVSSLLASLGGGPPKTKGGRLWPPSSRLRRADFDQMTSKSVCQSDGRFSKTASNTPSSPPRPSAS